MNAEIRTSDTTAGAQESGSVKWVGRRSWRTAVAAGVGLCALLAVSACSSASAQTATSAAAAVVTSLSAANSSLPTSTSVKPSPTVHYPKPPTTVVPQPTPGNIKQTVPSPKPAPTTSAAMAAVATFGGKVSVSVVRLTPVVITGHGVGEISGPAVALTFSITNGSAKSIDLSNVAVNMHDANGEAISPLSESPATPFKGVLAPGTTVKGVYVFSEPSSVVQPVSVDIRYSTAAPVVVFVGSSK